MNDLNLYRGFKPVTSVSAEGLASPNWGGTIKFGQSDGSFQGIYIGAGPYLSMQTSATIDPKLADFFASSTPMSIPDTSFHMSSDNIGQTALAVTGGYRARVGRPGSTSGLSDLDGLYIGANYHYLRGFRYENFEPKARLDTNAQGLVTVNPSLGVPVSILRTTSTNGNGWAIDVGAAAVVDRWQVGVGVNGIANRIDWTGVERTDYVLDSLFGGGDFVELTTVPVANERVELPVDVRANAAYNAPVWTAITEFGHGYNGASFRAGLERRFSATQLRGGTRYVNERWEPTGGVGLNLTRTFGIDFAAFGTSANLERKRHVAVAMSLRFTRGNP
jgi:hypothetical protein